MKRYFWMIALVAFIGLFSSQSANARDYGRRPAQRAYKAGYRHGARDARVYDRRHYYHGHYRPYYNRGHYYPRHRYYAPRPRPVVRVAVPVPPPPVPPRPRIVIHN